MGRLQFLVMDTAVQISAIQIRLIAADGWQGAAA